MGCSGCGRKRAGRVINRGGPANEVLGGYKYLNDGQIKARLEMYKKRHCSECESRYVCDYEMYVNCKVK